ncbi:MAG: GNAT family N-acetyltransferase, partial [Candidatus Obscuribacterales bacterium]|nr:GNAT family N-acetyltransferase [Candidatus Obscuribacterales bacterium]
MSAIRVATVADAAAVLDIYGPFCLPSSVVSFEIEPPSLSEIESRIAKTLESHPWLVCEEDGRVIAYAYAGQHKIRPAYNWCAEASVYLAPEARGRGIGKKLYSELFDILR